MTIKHCIEILDDLLVQTLNRIIPLHQLTKLIIKHFNLYFDQFIDILYSATHLHTFRSDLLSLDGINPIFIRKTSTFGCVLKKNKIKSLDLRNDCTLEKIQLFVDLFPQLEYLKMGMKSKEIQPIIKYLLSHRHNIPHLFLLCISEKSVIYLKQLTIMIQKEKLLDDYFIKLVSCDI